MRIIIFLFVFMFTSVFAQSEDFLQELIEEARENMGQEERTENSAYYLAWYNDEKTQYVIKECNKKCPKEMKAVLQKYIDIIAKLDKSCDLNTSCDERRKHMTKFQLLVAAFDSRKIIFVEGWYQDMDFVHLVEREWGSFWGSDCLRDEKGKCATVELRARNKTTFFQEIWGTASKTASSGFGLRTRDNYNFVLQSIYSEFNIRMNYLIRLTNDIMGEGQAFRYELYKSKIGEIREIQSSLKDFSRDLETFCQIQQSNIHCWDNGNIAQEV